MNYELHKHYISNEQRRFHVNHLLSIRLNILILVDKNSTSTSNGAIGTADEATNPYTKITMKSSCVIQANDGVYVPMQFDEPL